MFVSQVESGRIKEVIVDSRINKILSMRTDSVAMLEALDAISEFYVSNTVEARRSLRQDVEFQNINLAKKFLLEYDQVKQRIEGVEEYAAKLGSSCEHLASKVASANENMKLFMEKASELEMRKKMYIEQSKEIDLFLNHFQLSNEEIEVLHKCRIDDPLYTKKFFDSLHRLQTAHIDCKIMVEKHCYSAGFELLDMLSQHQNMAYQRLFKWVKEKCELFIEKSSAEEMDSLLQTAVRHLRKLPVYFSQCQDLIVNSRRSQLVQKFVVALTQGGGDGNSHRAIDLHAHDAIRYIGDMLAWMHQTLASEEEFLEAIFGGPQDAMVNGTMNTDKGDSEDDKATAVVNNEDIVGWSVPELLTRCLQGLGRPLRVRIQQTLELRRSAGPESLYTLCDLLCFYENTFAKILPNENAVHSAVKGTLLEAKRIFLSLIAKQSDLLCLANSSAISPSMDLSVSHTTKECCKQIHEILKVYASALSPLSADPGDPCCAHGVLGNIIPPLLQAVRISAQSMHQRDMAIYMLNNIAVVKLELKDAATIGLQINGSKGEQSVAQLSAEWLQLLLQEEQTWTSVLAEEEANKFMKRSDFDRLLDLLSGLSADRSLPLPLLADHTDGAGQGVASVYMLSAEKINTVIKTFYETLLNYSVNGLHLDRLTDLAMRAGAEQAAVAAVAAAYERVYQALGGGPPLSHSPAEVRVVLGCVTAQAELDAL